MTFTIPDPHVPNNLLALIKLDPPVEHRARYTAALDIAARVHQDMPDDFPDPLAPGALEILQKLRKSETDPERLAYYTAAVRIAMSTTHATRLRRPDPVENPASIIQPFPGLRTRNLDEQD